MYCTKCGKEIPEGENKICEDCQKKLISEIATGEEVEKEEIKPSKKKKENKSQKTEKFEIKKDVKTKKKVWPTIITILILAIIACLATFIYEEYLKLGNTIGNIRNYGYAAKQGEWIYYLSPNEDSSKIGIFKTKAGDKEYKPECLIMEEWDILSVNVVGNYIYFIGISSEPYSEDDEIDNKIYRIRTDGTDLKVINDNEFNNNCYEIYVVHNKVYYIGTDINVYKMNIDGSNRELVLENQTGYLGITDKYIIYNVENEDETDYITYIANLDGTNQRPIIENTRIYSVNVVGNYVYYTNENMQICRVKIDGTEQSMILDVTAYNMNVSKDYIYYLNYLDEKNSNYTVAIYRVKTDGTSETPETVKILDTYSSFIDIVGDWIIYMDSDEEEGFINLVKIDGSDLIRLYTLNYEELKEIQEDEEEIRNTVEDENVVDTNTVVEGNVTNSTNTVTTQNTVNSENTVKEENKVENTNTVKTENVANTIADTNTVSNETNNTNTVINAIENTNTVTDKK